MSNKPLLAWLTILAVSGCDKKPAAEPEVSSDSETARSEAPGAANESEATVLGSEGDPDEIPGAPEADAERGSVGLLAEATRVLGSMTSSRYSHKTHIEGTSYEVDCSGFVDYLLARTNPAALAELRADTVKRPLAKHFVAFLEAAERAAHWQRLPRVQDLEPGDIIAWEKPAHVVSTNTGHVMVVAAKPEPRGAAEWAVAIIDSSASPHGKSDSRSRARATGVGRGVLRLEVDPSGAPLSYRWSDRRASVQHRTKILLGRIRQTP